MSQQSPPPFGVPPSTNNANPPNTNPFRQFRCCCTNFNIRDHAQLCCVLSFTLFLCLVVLSLMLFGALSICYVMVGIAVYSLLMKTLFGTVDKLAILLYLVFEAIQIGFYLALLIYVATLLFLNVPTPTQQCYVISSTSANGTAIQEKEFCESASISHVEEYFELFLFISAIASAKIHFARVFAHFYKFLAWNDKMSVHRAQYFNGRGQQIQITMDQHHQQLFPAPPPNFWDNHQIVRDSEYGYSVANIGQLPLPTYSQAIGQSASAKQNDNDEKVGGAKSDRSSK